MIVNYTDNLNNLIYDDALTIRKKVFIDEQGVPAELEYENEAECLHFVLYDTHRPVATCRLLLKSATTAKLQRMAVSKESRKQNLGKILITETESIAKNRGIQTIVLGAQNTAIGFYEKLGYHITGPEFMDANIPHHNMEKTL
ncbi:GNAT family N-acetyltransferase [Vagococcus salmoninarum]|uniref:GNAT family N-acetyltransferase n=2 Tax=Vagococcus salmoninarum TaxID=2739 RepID=UPI0028CFDEF2|nr:GNAT family N-acetyltransferase [Vagococcus salmoninarum]